jgi:hypothetical protein
MAGMSEETTEPLSVDPAPSTEVVSSKEARQGGLGKPVLTVLIGALILAAIAWVGVELWGETIDRPEPKTAATSN